MIRLLSIVFLFIALINNANSQTYIYYKAGGTCSFSKDKFCADSLKALEQPFLNTAKRFTQLSCDSGSSSVTLRYQTAMYNYLSNTLYDIDNYNYFTAAEVMSTQCDKQLTLKSDCTLICQEDPCKPLEGQKFSKTVDCGTATCPNGGVVVDNGGTLSCSNGSGLIVPTPIPTTTYQECNATLVQPVPIPSSFQVRNSAIGQSSTTAYCSMQYQYTGTSGADSETPTDLKNMSLSGAIPTTENGQCPTGYKKGSYALGEQDPNNPNNQYICIPDTPTNNTCTAPKIRDNSGQCVDPEDAAQCETGQVRDASGACVTPNSDTGGDDDNNEPDPDTGGGDGGDCFGVGCDAHNKDSDTDGDGIPDKDDNLTDSDGDGDADKGNFYEDNCGKTPACSGDPVQCQIMRNQWKANCEANRPLNDDEKGLATKAGSEVDKQTSDALSEFQNKVNSVINENSLFTTSNNTNATCIPDKQIKIIGNSFITVKYSLLCPYFSLLRNILILVAYMFAARIVYAEVSGGGIRV